MTVKPTALGGGPPAPPTPTLLEIFLTFSGIALLGFGGALPWAQRALVEKRKWMTIGEFAEALAIAQFLPGGNIMNLAVGVGQRFRGVLGALSAVAGLIVLPMIVVIVLGAIYFRYGQIEWVGSMLAGVAAGAAGLIIALAAKLARPLFKRGDYVPVGLAAVIFVAMVVLKLPLLLVLAIFVPVSIGYHWWRKP